MSSTPEILTRHCPSFEPTGLADGLELEVFFVNYSRLAPSGWFPRVDAVRFARLQLRQTLVINNPHTTPVTRSAQATKLAA